MTVQRREIIASGFGAVLVGVPLQNDIAAAEARGQEEEALIDEFRKVVGGLRDTTSGSIPLPSRIAEVRRLGQVLRERGIIRIVPGKPGDIACNHWLANVERSF